METLTHLQREIGTISRLPADERTSAGRDLAIRLDDVLTEAVAAETAHRCWLQLARAVTGRPVSVPDGGDPRAVAYALLGGIDPADEIRAAREADDRAQEEARRTRAALRTAVLRGRERGIGPSELARLSGTTRRAVNDWLDAGRA